MSGRGRPTSVRRGRGGAPPPEKELLTIHVYWVVQLNSQALEEIPGYLLPYRHQFVICESAGIDALGLDPDDPDWERIGYDWVRPSDPAAWARLRTRRLHVLQATRAS